MKDTTGGADGDNNGFITVRGCHANATALDICVCGSTQGNISVLDTDCTYQPAVTCSGCP